MQIFLIHQLKSGSLVTLEMNAETKQVEGIRSNQYHCQFSQSLPMTMPLLLFHDFLTCLFQVLFIPFSATGVFYPIAPRGGRNPQHIYPLTAIARIHRLPLKIKMVYGALPQNIPDFTGELILLE